MSQRFNYLLQRFKTDELSGDEQEEWHDMVESGAWRDDIQQDIEASLNNSMPDLRWNAALEDNTWKNILAACEDPLPAPENLPVSGNPPAPENLPVPAPAVIRWFRPLPMAAAACILLAFGIWWLSRTPSATQPEIVTSAPTGGTTFLILPDSTKVRLDAASTLTCAAGFATTNRNVVLQGQASFEVSPNSHLPFRVKAAGQQIDVLGTRFNISAYPGDLESGTTLLEGSIQVSKGRDRLLLQPGQEAVTASGLEGLQLRTADTAQVMAWQNNLFSFRSTLLHDVMHQLERWYAIQIQCGPAADTLHVTGYVSRRKQLEDVLKMLAYTNNLHYSIKGHTVQLEVLSK
jgi:ferric-dicitrate binding protein FerR (iron transport regulator)